MFSKYKLFFYCILIITLTSCMATPDIHVKNSDMSIGIKKYAPFVMRISVSPDGKYVLSGNVNSTFSLWDITMGKEIEKFTVKPINNNMGQGVQVAFSKDEKYVMSAGPNNFKLWSIATGKEISSFDIDSLYEASISTSADGRKVLLPEIRVFSNYLHLLEISEDNTIKLLKSIKVPQSSRPESVAISPNGKYALLGNGRGMIELWNLEKEEREKEMKGGSFTSGIVSVGFSPDGKYALSGGTNNSVKYWDVFSGKEIKSFEGHISLMGIQSVTFSPDGKVGLSGGCDALMKMWDLSAGSEIRSIRGHTSTAMDCVASAKFTPDGKRIVSSGEASVRIWDVATGEEIATMIGFDDGEWIVLTTEGYYNASEKGAQYHVVKMQDKAYTVDQFYDVFYRPDIVAAKLRGDDIKDLITITMQDAIKTPPPSIEFTTSETDKPRAKICYQAKSTGGGIGEVRLFHNGKLVESDGYYREVVKTQRNTITALNSKAIYEDMRSVSIKGSVEKPTITNKTKGDIVEDCKEIETISGENEISITAFNRDNTIQSAMKTIKFNSKTPPTEPDLYILAIGITEYKDKTITLKYAAKDAKDIEEKLIKQASTIYDPKNIKYAFLKDAEATKVNVISKINELSKTIRPNDSFILFIAGHGVLLQNQYYILTNDYDGTIDTNKMISSNEIVEMSKKIKSLSQLFIFDTCHAGGVDTIISGLYDARMSVLAKKMGLHIYASANSLQQALDGYQNNGLFTYTLLDGLSNKKEADQNKDNIIGLIELGDYSRQTTSDISKQLGHQQTPLIINFGKDNAVYNLK